MDDLIHSCQNQSEADKRIDELNQLLKTGKFQIKEWYCSSKSTSSVNEVNLDGEYEVKTLGLGWNPVTDILKFTVKPVNVNVFTKRIVLSKMSTLFDPLGLATPVTVKMRMAMQEMWRNKQLVWDDRLSEEDSRIWSILFDEMYCLINLSFPRCLKSTQAYGKSELHVFCDASLKAYGAVVYIVWSTSNGREVQLVTSKVRVSPLRQSTIPRLELMAALIGCCLAKTVTDELKAKPDKVVIWSDSHVVLHWIGSESVNMKPFVGVRVTEIQSTWKWSNFKYVPTGLNPADDLSRGLTVDRMTERWMSGPGFLKCHESDWPVQPTSSPVIDESSLPDQENFKDICPFVENGLVRVGGRLRHIALSYDQCHPVLLPQDHHVTELIIREYHRKSCHAGAERTLADIRQKFWIPHGRKVVKKVVKSCVICRKLRQSPCETLMGDFPSDRLKPLSPPFTTTGVDLFGPFLIKYGRNKSIKAWGAIFTCSTTRAIHLEIVQDLSTQSFLFALRRFSAHHGWPTTFISDNGSNFIGAEKELEKLF